MVVTIHLSFNWLGSTEDRRIGYFHLLRYTSTRSVCSPKDSKRVPRPSILSQVCPGMFGIQTGSRRGDCFLYFNFAPTGWVTKSKFQATIIYIVYSSVICVERLCTVQTINHITANLKWL